MGMDSGGMIDVVAMSPITIIQNVLALDAINYTSTHDATGGNMGVTSGVSIVSTTGAVNFYAGDNFTEDADLENPVTRTVVVAATSINIYGDYENNSGPGSAIMVDGELIAPNINVYENGADSVVDLNNPSGINNATGGYPGQPAGLLTVTGGPGNNQLNVNDSADTSPRNGILTATTLTGLGIGGLGIAYTSIVNNKPSNQPYIFNVVVLLGTGNDVFTIESTNAPTSTEVVNTGAAQDQFYVESETSQAGVPTRSTPIVDDIKGPLTIQGFGNDTMTVVDTGSFTPKSGNLTATSLTGLNMGPAGITYSGLSGLNISLGYGGMTGNTFNIAVAAGTNLPATTTIHGGSEIPDSLTASWGGDFNGTLSLIDFTSPSITIANNLNGSLSDILPGTVQTMTIGGSITASGVLTVGSVNSLTIQHNLAGQLIVQSALDSLVVHGGTPGAVVAGQIGTIAVSAAYGPVVAQIQEDNIERLIEAAVPSSPFPILAPTPAVSPGGITFQYFYEGLISPSVEGESPSASLVNPQVTARVMNATGNTGPDQFDFSLVTYSDTAKFNLARLDATGNSGVSGIRNVAVEGDILTAVTPAAATFFAGDHSPAGIYLPEDNLAGVAVRDYAPSNIIAAKSIQAVAFGSTTGTSGRPETGSVASGSDAARLLSPETAIVQAGSSNGSTMETFRVPVADVATETVGFFMDDTPGSGHFDNNSVDLVVQSVSTANTTGTANIVTSSNAARGAVIALINVAETFSHKSLQNSIIESISLRGDGGSIQTNQTIGSLNAGTQTMAPFTPSITSTGPLGDVTIQGALPNVTAPSIFGSLLPSGPIPATTTIETTGIRIDPITSATSDVPADLGRVYIVTTAQGPVVAVTQVQSNGSGLAGQILCGGNLISQVVSNGATTGIITVQPVAWEPGAGNLGTSVTFGRGSVLNLGGFISNGPLTAPSVSVGNSAGTTNVSGVLEGGIITTYGSVIGNIVINGSMNGPTVSAGNNGSVLNESATLEGGIITTYGSVTGNITIDGSMNGPTISAGNNGSVINESGTLEGGFITTDGSVTGDITVTGAMSGPALSAGSSGTQIKVNGPVQGGSIITTGSSTGTVAINGAVSGPTVSAGPGSTITVNVPLKGGSVLTGGTLGNLSIGGPLSGMVVTVGNMNGTVTINGPVQKGVIATSGSINGSLTIGGPLSGGQILSAGTINGNVTIKGSLQSGRIASLGSIIGTLTIDGQIDSQSAVVSGGSIGSKNKLIVGAVNGILAAVGPINIVPTATTNSAVYFKPNDTLDAAVIDAIFSQGVSALSPTDLFDRATLLDLENLSVILVNQTSLTVKNGKLQI
jgi:hypothetical protein